MAEYTIKDIIMDPEDPRLEGAIGKQCYLSDYPKNVLDYAKNNSTVNRLKSINKESACPFVGEHKASWAVVIIKKKEPYSERAKKWIEQYDLKEGDYVKVTRKVDNHEDEWQGLWLDYMDESVGKTLKVKDIDTYIYTIGLENGFYYPYFVLEKTEPPKLKYVPFSNYEDFMDAYISCLERNKEDTGREAFLANHGIWLYNKFSGELACVTNICDNGVVLSGRELFVDDNGYASYETVEWETLLDLCEFLDCSPCGKLIEET